MLSLQEIENHYKHLSSDQLNIILEVHNQVAEIAGGVTERLDRWGITYFDASRGGPVSAGICQTLIEPDHIRLAFIHGTFLPDPLHLLQGNRQYKRYIKLDTYDHVPWEAVRSIITASNNFDPYSPGSPMDDEKI